MAAGKSVRPRARQAIARVLVSARQRSFALARRLGWMPLQERVRWFGASSPKQAARALAARAAGFPSPPGSWILVVGEDGPRRQNLERELGRRGLRDRVVRSVSDFELSDAESRALAGIVVADVEAAKITEVARQALADPKFSAAPFEYASGLEPERAQLRAQDEYADTFFISPVLLADPSPYELYAASLEIFEQKCGLRDYLDLYQLLLSVVQRGVPGDIAEFGSYKGHSGWLIGKTMQALGSDKAIHLFDTFESFPTESAGVDYFWSDTHQVHLDEVQEKLAGLEAIHLVPGEFERTVPASTINEIALAYVDCDSYRAVSYLARTLFEDHLSPGGVMVFEDYGHPALLGCRVAVHEHFDGRDDCFRFFSQFSGLYIVMKLTGNASPR